MADERYQRIFSGNPYSGITDNLDRIKKEADGILVMDAQNSFRRAVRDRLLAKDTGILNLKGQKVFNVHETFPKELQDMANQYEANLTNKDQRMMFRNSIPQMSRPAVNEAIRHANSEINKYNTRVFDDSDEEINKNAVINYTDEDSFKNGMDQITQVSNSRADHLGLVGEQKKAFVDDRINNYVGNFINRYLQDDPENNVNNLALNIFWEKNKGLLDVKTRLHFQKEIGKANIQNEVDRIVKEVTTSHDPLITGSTKQGTEAITKYFHKKRGSSKDVRYSTTAEKMAKKVFETLSDKRQEQRNEERRKLAQNAMLKAANDEELTPQDQEAIRSYSPETWYRIQMIKQLGKFGIPKEVAASQDTSIRRSLGLGPNYKSPEASGTPYNYEEASQARKNNPVVFDRILKTNPSAIKGFFKLHKGQMQKLNNQASDVNMEKTLTNVQDTFEGRFITVWNTNNENKLLYRRPRKGEAPSKAYFPHYTSETGPGVGVARRAYKDFKKFVNAYAENQDPKIRTFDGFDDKRFYNNPENVNAMMKMFFRKVSTVIRPDSLENKFKLLPFVEPKPVQVPAGTITPEYLQHRVYEDISDDDKEDVRSYLEQHDEEFNGLTEEAKQVKILQTYQLIMGEIRTTPEGLETKIHGLEKGQLLIDLLDPI